MSAKTDIATEEYKQKYGFSDPIDSYAVKGIKGLSERVVQEISRIHDEPAWMEQIRMKALRNFLDRTPPAWAPELSTIDFQSFYYYASPTSKPAASWDQLPDYIKRTYDKLGITEAEKKFLAGVGAIYESEAVYHSIQGELAKQGVVFTDTVTALKQFPDVMKKYFGTVVPYQDNYIAALQTAVWSAGSFVYVPSGVKVTTPLQAYFRINERNMGQFERTLIIGEPYSEVTYIEGCLPADELVSEGSKMKPILLVDKNEEVVAESGRIARVSGKFVHPLKGKMITIIPLSRGNSFRLTPEHPVLAIRRGEVKANRKARNGWLLEVSTEKLTKAVPRYIEAGQLHVGDFLVYVAPRETTDCPALTDTLLKILGLYLAEGSVSYNKSLERQVAQFSFGSSASEESLARELVSLIRSTGEKASMHKSRGLYYSVSTYSGRLIGLLLSHCGTGAGTKMLSEAIMKLPAEKQMLILRYYLMGDGNHYLKNGRSLMIRASTVSSALAFQMQEMLARNGVFANLSVRRGSRDRILGREIERKDQYMIEYTEGKKWSEVRRVGNHFFVPIKVIQEEEYDDLVYNLEVERENSYLVKGFAVHNCTAPVYSSQSLHSAIVEIVAQKGSLVKYTTLQNWSRDVLNLVTKRAHAYEEATVSWVDFNGGSRLTRKYPSIYLLGPRAKADIISVAYAGAGQVQDTGGKAVHLAKDTTSRIISRSVSKDGGHTAYRGLLHIAKGATNVRSTVRCDALLIDEKSTTATYPYMEIQEDDATVTHEASVGKVGEEQLFYLMSRGISERDALSMVVNGFLEPFAKELPMAYAVEFNRLMSLEMTNTVG